MNTANSQTKRTIVNRNRTTTIVAAGALGLAMISGLDGAQNTAPAVAPDASTSSFAERLKKLEVEMEALKKENVELNKQLGGDGKSPLSFVKPGGKEKSLKIGGVLQGQAEFGRQPDARFSGVEDRFLLRRARLTLTGAFAEQFDFKMEGDFGAGSLSEKTGYSAQLTDLYVNWNRYDFANVKFGQFKSPFGFEQLVSDPKLTTIERSLANDRLTEGRQIGFGVNGEFLSKRLGYSAGVFNGTSVNNSFNDNEQFMFAGRVTGVPYEGKWGKQDVKWTVGVNGLATEDGSVATTGLGFDSVPGGAVDNLFVGQRTGLGLDTQFKAGPFGLEAEYLRAHFEPDNNLPCPSLDGEGWYVMGTYYVIAQKLQALVRYETFDPNVDILGDSTDTWTIGLTYFLKGDDLKFSLNYLIGNPPGSGSQGRLLARVQLMF